MLQRPNKKMGELVLNLLNSATVIHLAHLKTRSYAAHKALNEYYDAIPDLADSLAEEYQGATLTLLTYPSSTDMKSPLSTEELCTYLMDLKDQVTREQTACTYSEIVNLMDNIKSLINSTCYKLKFLS